MYRHLFTTNVHARFIQYIYILFIIIYVLVYADDLETLQRILKEQTNLAAARIRNAPGQRDENRYCTFSLSEAEMNRPRKMGPNLACFSVHKTKNFK